MLPLEEGGPNLFQLLGLPDKGSFAIDQGAIKLAFLQGSKNVHPDGFKGKEEVSPAQREPRTESVELTTGSPSPTDRTSDRISTRSAAVIYTQQGLLYTQGSSAEGAISRPSIHLATCVRFSAELTYHRSSTSDGSSSCPSLASKYKNLTR